MMKHSENPAQSLLSPLTRQYKWAAHNILKSQDTYSALLLVANKAVSVEGPRDGPDPFLLLCKWFGCCSHCDHKCPILVMTLPNLHLNAFKHSFLKHGHWVILLRELLDKKPFTGKWKCKETCLLHIWVWFLSFTTGCKLAVHHSGHGHKSWVFFEALPLVFS